MHIIKLPSILKHMASQIYNRYKPSSLSIIKSDHSTPGDIPEPKRSLPQDVLEIRQDTSGTYARYIPSQKSRPDEEHLSPNLKQRAIPSNHLKRKLHIIPSRESSHKSESGNLTEHEKSPSTDALDPMMPLTQPSTILVKPSKLQRREESVSEYSPKIKNPRFAQQLFTGEQRFSKSSSKEKIGSDASTKDEQNTLKQICPTFQKSSEELDNSDIDKVKNIGAKRVNFVVNKEIIIADERHSKILHKFERSLSTAKNVVNNPVSDSGKKPVEESADLHGLTPLPQPSPVDDYSPIASADSLPPWLLNSIRVPSHSTAKFEDFGLQNYVIKSLQSRGIAKAFAVQLAAFQLLLPGTKNEAGDVVISAATGSGKTLSYILPMIKDIHRHHVSKLRGLVVIPTRELVSQVKDVAETCAEAFSKGDNRKCVKIGTAIGNQTIKSELHRLIEREQKYNPEEYERLLFQAEHPWQNNDDLDGGIQSIFEGNPLSFIPGLVDEFRMKVNVLICTPGRLVEHIKSSPGFSLRDIKWLVIDEADKLLEQSFQQWLPLLMSEINSSHKSYSRKNRVRKVVLSATMTRNLSQLAQLKLYRPSLIILEGEGIKNTQRFDELQKHMLPSSLLEFSVKVEEDDMKPLYFMELLKRLAVIDKESLTKVDSSFNTNSLELKSGSGSDLDLDSGSISGLDSGSDSSNSISPSNVKVTSSMSFTLQQDFEDHSLHGVLVFCKSNETAARLGRFIALLSPSLYSHIGILASTLPRSTRRTYLNLFVKKKISILVASDLISRGLDIPNLAHVINYDMPSSLISYIHRVGRTARAGKVGYAWTLFTNCEAGWFWNEIGCSSNIQRSRSKIERLSFKDAFSNEQRKAYQIALEKLGKEVA